MPFQIGGVAIHNDDQHTGSAKRDTASGVAGLDASGDVLSMGDSVRLTRDGGNVIRLMERISNETALRLIRTGASQYQGQIDVAEGNGIIQLHTMKNIAGGIAGLDGNGNMGFAQFPPGLIFPYGAAAAPEGTLLCNGAAVSRATYAALFAVIGVTYGIGDGATTFNVPNFMGRTILGAGAGAGLTARACGDVGGEETHVLTTAEMPAHTHSVGAGSGSAAAAFATKKDDTNNSPITTSSAGSGGAHNNVQPFGVASYIITT